MAGNIFCFHIYFEHSLNNGNTTDGSPFCGEFEMSFISFFFIHSSNLLIRIIIIVEVKKVVGRDIKEIAYKSELIGNRP